jgi:hypothetical protein
MTSKVVSKEDQYWLEVTKDLFSPRGDGIKVGLDNRLHDGQIEALAPLYEDGVNTLMLPCGRKFGKTDAASFVLWHQALFVPGSACYFIAPEGSHGRELIWRNKRLQQFMGADTQKYILKESQQDMTIYLKNGSFIRIMGSENWAAGNGLTPHIAVYDEFKAFHPQWHVEFSPNRAAKAAKLVIIGTLPKPGDRNIEQYTQVLEYCKRNKDSKVITRTTWDNPINLLPDQKLMIEQDIERLRDHGDEDIVQREYYSKIVAGGSASIFPMLDEKTHIIPHKDLIAEIKRDIKKLEWYCVADPGTTTCFAVLFAAINPYTKKMYILDEVYAKNQSETSTSQIYKQVKMRTLKLNPFIDLEDWYKVYDEAGAWFANEILTRYDVTFFKTVKRHGDKEEGLGVIKDQLIHNSVAISDQCTNLFEEMRMYAKDIKGKIPKKNDHLIDCYRYLLDSCNYDFNSVLEYVRIKDPMEEGRFLKYGQERDETEMDGDWTSGFGDDFDLDYD